MIINKNPIKRSCRYYNGIFMRRIVNFYEKIEYITRGTYSTPFFSLLNRKPGGDRLRITSATYSRYLPIIIIVLFIFNCVSVRSKIRGRNDLYSEVFLQYLHTRRRSTSRTNSVRTEPVTQ